MPRNPELDQLRREEQQAFRRKQDAYRRYDELRKQASDAYDTMELLWRERSDAKDTMNREFYLRKEVYEHHDAIWSDYGRIRDHNNTEIDQLRAEADAEHEAMKDAFDRASDAYEYGDRSEAPYYASEGHDHKDRRDELNERVRELIQEIKDAKAYAIANAPPVDSSAFNSAKAEYDRAKAEHLAAEAEFKRIKAERDQAKAEFDHCQAEHVRLKQAFQEILTKVKAEHQRSRDRTLDKAGVRWLDRKDAKIVQKPDGTTQVYHGGLGSGDGLGHGHTVLDGTGHKTYDRDAFSSHGSQNYTDNEDKNGSSPGTSRRNRFEANKNGGWGPYIRGTIEGHEVTLRQGTGEYEGHTLIADGFVSGKQFSNKKQKYHNHYGPDTKYGTGRRVEDIDGDRGAYTGPGH
ncbi:putative nuclear RNA export factor SDE5 [Candidatus Saccharibacteria bacterium]|nr:putative nuclear RNA export factor SDE5 [Candidatus Saccharibacteria bacterium]